LNHRLRLLLAVLFVSAATLNAAETPIPPAPSRWVTDTANFMSPGAVSSLDARLDEYARGTGHQLIVYIGTTTGDAPIEDWAVRAFEKWKVGRKGIDDGLALFIMSADRKLRFEVGYGLEGDVPDVTASRIINEVIVPRIRAGDQDGAVTAGVDAVINVIGGQGLPAQGRGRGQGQQRPLTLAQLIFYAIVGIFLLGFLVTHPTLAMWLLFSFLGGGGRRRGGGWDGGGGGWGGGGFSGGGGRSGGGGASGSW